jgi:hypothetical protein
MKESLTVKMEKEELWLSIRLERETIKKNFKMIK